MFAYLFTTHLSGKEGYIDSFMKDTSLNKIAWHKLKKNKLAFFSLCYIFLSFFIALFSVVLSPDSSPNANEMHIQISKKKPLTEVMFLQIPLKQQTKNNFVKSIFIGAERNYKRIPIDYYKKLNKEIIVYSEYGSNKKLNYSGDYKILNQKFWLGTDKFGRDYLSRIIHGSRISLSVGLISVFISLIIGITLGLIAGYYRGVIDDVIMWLVNIIWSIPTLLMVIAITLALGKGFWQVFIAIGFTMWVEVARVVRGQVLIVRELEYIEAGKVLAYKSFRIIFKHILPNIIGPVIVISAANFASAILIESGLSFLGIGAQPPVASWGNMIKDHYSYIIMDKAYLAIIPGLAIMSYVLAFMLLGNGLREVFDVKNK